MRHIVVKLTIITVFLAVMVSCSDDSVSPPPDNSNRVTIKQGVWGNVTFWEGNFMPGLDNDKGSESHGGNIDPVVRDVLVYKGVTFDDVERSEIISSLYGEINGELVAETRSDASGFYQVSLPAGDYSVFVREGENLYFGGMSSDQYLMHAKVTEGERTKFEIDIDYKAAY